ncbi:unnamed protein product [Periconia digitata]|uniref:Uncharacterized protein n=1 Tax=Periconia digitata TaxID=1303443 RepID=A0A9W4XVK9_9PLEO|nr:unnamed protein product [Periconia digitata]
MASSVSHGEARFWAKRAGTCLIRWARGYGSKPSGTVTDSHGILPLLQVSWRWHDTIATSIHAHSYLSIYVQCSGSVCILIDFVACCVWLDVQLCHECSLRVHVAPRIPTSTPTHQRLPTQYPTLRAAPVGRVIADSQFRRKHDQLRLAHPRTKTPRLRLFACFPFAFADRPFAIRDSPY